MTTTPARPAVPPHVLVRLAVTTGDRTTRTDLVLRGSQGSLRTDGAPARAFPVARLWPVVRDLLPGLPHLVADPAITPAADRRPVAAADPDAYRHVVTVVVGTAGAPGGEAVGVRTWWATADALHALTPSPDGTTALVAERPGALAATLQWDIAGALDHLARALRARGAA